MFRRYRATHNRASPFQVDPHYTAKPKKTACPQCTPNVYHSILRHNRVNNGYHFPTVLHNENIVHILRFRRRI